MAIGKNAKKRAARRAFHDAPCEEKPGAMPYSFKVVEYRRADDMAVSREKPVTGSGMVRRVLTFASLTSYKDYRKEFFSRNPTGTLSLVNPLSDDVVADRGKAFRSKVINRGADTSKAKPKAILKGIASQYGVKGKAFDKPASEYDALQSIEGDRLKQVAIDKEDVRKINSHALRDIRQTYRKV